MQAAWFQSLCDAVSVVRRETGDVLIGTKRKSKKLAGGKLSSLKAAKSD